MDILRDAVECTVKYPCSNDSCNSFLCEDPDHSPNFIQDPMRQHCIELRGYIEKCNNVLEEYQRQAKELGEPNPPNTTRLVKAITLPPPLPETYPSLGTLGHPKHLKRMQLQNEFKEDTEVIEFHQYFVNSICAKMGCYFDEDVIIELGKSNERFLKKFIDILCQTKDIFNENDILAQLDFTLLRIGFNGIKGLYHFYQEQIIKKHASLLHTCEALHIVCKKKYNEVESLKRNAENSSNLVMHSFLE